MRTLAIILITTIALLQYSCISNRIKDKPEWGTYFKQIGIDSAGFEVFEQKKERVFYYNKAYGKRRTNAAATFNLVTALIALERGIAPSEDMVLRGVGANSTNPVWQKDMNMVEAFRTNNPFYFAELANKIGRTEMQKWVDTLRYGTKTLGEDFINAASNGTMQISLDEQVGLLKRLYFNQLPCTERTQRILRTLLDKKEKVNKYAVYKQSNSYGDSLTNKQWLIGIVEDSTAHPYFFAGQIESKDKSKNLDSLLQLVMKQVFNEMKIPVE
jgi:beta-lactamase class D